LCTCAFIFTFNNHHIVSIEIDFDLSLNSDDEFSIHKRVKVLKAALVLESEITKLLKLYLNVDESLLKRGLQALGDKSNNIPFVSKLWLLHDIGVLDDSEVNTLKALMEIRNKFLHVLECKNFEDAVNNENKKILLKLDIWDAKGGGISLEDRLGNGFHSLMKECIDIIIAKKEKKKILIEEKMDTLQGINDMFDVIYKSDGDLIKNLLSLTYDFKSDNLELQEFAIMINKIISKHQKDFMESVELLAAQEKIKQIQQENRIFKLINL
jgi:hypothetical protein